MDLRAGIFSIPDFAKSHQFPAAPIFLSPESNPPKTHHVGKTDHSQHRTDDQLQPPLSGMSIRLEVVYPADRNAAGETV